MGNRPGEEHAHSDIASGSTPLAERKQATAIRKGVLYRSLGL